MAERQEGIFVVSDISELKPGFGTYWLVSFGEGNPPPFARLITNKRPPPYIETSM
jgi:hypothetical protein